jgi:hypothetical protein
MIYSDHDIEYYGDAFRRLDERYQVCSAHHVTFELFMRAPAESERWIHIYFANPTLLARRREGANVMLKAFLENGPQLVLLGAVEMDAVQREALREASWQLLRRQQIAANVFDDMNVFAIQEEEDRHFERTHTVEQRGSCYIEAFHHHHPPSKRKTGWGLHAY